MVWIIWILLRVEILVLNNFISLSNLAEKLVCGGLLRARGTLEEAGIFLVWGNVEGWSSSEISESYGTGIWEVVE